MPGSGTMKHEEYPATCGYFHINLFRCGRLERAEPLNTRNAEDAFLDGGEFHYAQKTITS